MSKRRRSFTSRQRLEIVLEGVDRRALTMATAKIRPAPDPPGPFLTDPPASLDDFRSRVEVEGLERLAPCLSDPAVN